MAKVQFNCRLDEDVAGWIAGESERRSVDGKKFSQADVITLLVGSAAFTDGKAEATVPRKVSRRDAHVAALRASDPLAGILERDDIEHGNMELPSSGSVGTLDAVGPKVSEGQGKASFQSWRAVQKPLLKPRDRK